MRVLITGDKGFVGQHLINELKKRKRKIVGFSLQDGRNIFDYEQLRNTLDQERPDEIYYLVAQAFVPESFLNPSF